MEKTKAIYVLLTRTQTKVASLVRRFGNVKYYNHCALALDKELTQLFAFARPEQHGLLLGKMVRETKDRYTNGDTVDIPACVVEFPLTEEEYKMVCDRVHEIESDKEYMCNFLSVITHPFKGGMNVYKSYSCVEFVAAILKMIDSELSLDACRYLPDDLYLRYQDKILFEGDLRDYMSVSKRDDSYFKGLSWGLLFLNMIALDKIIRRCLFSIFIDLF